ncbi:kinase-like protein [Gigaspora margarita]|uniref:Kinase-like protein n=1 Tax=Gigaspora margarita TaxID=4874 RepID=A0A8H4EPL9_GIGMA|nr:kinase-like protein [Gigaspora margarita]
MNETEKKFVKYLKLGHGLQYKDGNFIHTEPLIDEGQLKIEDYTKVHIYESTEKKQISTWDIISKKFQTLENEKLEPSSGCLPREHLKIIIPILKITYVGNPLDCFKSYAEKLDRTELCQQFLAETILVGGGLIIKNVSDFENKLKLDISKAHIIWIIDEISRNHKYKNPFKKSIVNFSELYDLDNNPILDEKQLGDYVNQLFSYEKFSVIAYEKVIPAFTRLDKQLQDSFKTLHKIPADWSMNINKRLVPGITSFHQEKDINDWLINNITINLPYWIKKYHMESGILLTQDGFACSKEKVLEFLCEPEFNFSETTSLKIFHIKSSIDLLMNVNKIDVKEKQDFQINPFNSVDQSKSKVDAIACNIIQEQLKIQIRTDKNKIKVSNQFKEDIEKALESNNPYSNLTNIFDKYGHYFCKNYILGNSLESMCYSYSDLPTERFIHFQRSKVSKELDNLIKEWKNFQSKFEVNSFSDDRSIVKSEKVEKWLDENNLAYPEAWYVVNRTDLIPIWKLLDSNIQERINELIKDEERILMIREEIIGREITCHRIKFDTPLRSNQYQIIGSIVTVDYKKTSLAVKFRLMDCYGFYAIIEKHKSANEVINSELKICWALIGKPLKHDYFNYELSNIKLISGNKKFEMNKERISDTVNIDINRPIPPQNLIFATILEFPSTNFEPAIEVIINSSTLQKINYTLVNNKFEDIESLLKDNKDLMPFEYHFKWYIIDMSGYENLFSWDSVGYEIDIKSSCLENNSVKTSVKQTTIVMLPNSRDSVKKQTMADASLIDKIKIINEFINKLINEENKFIKKYEYNLFSNFPVCSRGPPGNVCKVTWENSTLQKLATVDKHKHPNIIRFYGIANDPNKIRYDLILQFAVDGNLRKYLKSNFSKLKWTDKLRYAHEISKGLSFLHDNKIIHKNLHSKNILVHHQRMLIVDFWRFKHQNEETLIKAEMCGYIEPQCFIDARYECDERSDIYSLGVIFWEISSGRLPYDHFEHNQAIIFHVYEGNRETPVENTPDDYVKLYQSCWDQKPEKRPKIKTVLEELKKMRLSLIDNQTAFHEKWIESKVIEGRINEYKIDEFEDCKLINSGASSKVYKTRFKNTNNIFALKVIEKNDYTNKEIINELECMISVESHENIIKFQGITYLMDKMDANVVEYGLILEYADNGTLRDYLHKNSTKIEWELKIQFAIQLVEAVKWLHTHNFIHGDLHPNNILIHGETLKLADFGLSQRVTKASVSQTSSEIFGIIPYIDPQCFKTEPNKDGNFCRYRMNKKSDIYSIGVILWEISSEKQPFKNENYASLPARIIDGLREEPFADTPFEYVIIYKRCWQSMQDDRPSIEEVAMALKNFQDITINYYFDIFDISEFIKYIDTVFEGIAENFNLDATLTDQDSMTLFVNNLYSTFSKLFNEGESANDIIINFISKSDRTKEEVFQWLLENNNHPRYICLLGLFYHWMIGTDEKNVKIVELFVNAANKGDTIAQYFAGKCYAEGWSTNKNKKKALEWYSRAAENECAAAECVLGEYFYKLKKFTKAFGFLERAAKHGNLKAKNTLKLGYQNDQGTGTNAVEVFN